MRVMKEDIYESSSLSHPLWINQLYEHKGLKTVSLDIYAMDKMSWEHRVSFVAILPQIISLLFFSGFLSVHMEIPPKLQRFATKSSVILLNSACF